MYFDRWTGALIRDVGYRDYGGAGKAIELGVQLHTGNYFGLATQLVMLTTCIGIVLLIVSESSCGGNAGLPDGSRRHPK